MMQSIQGNTPQHNAAHSSDDDSGPAGTIHSIVGDIIGDTAYSERYVLKILIKFAKVEVFRKVIDKEGFECELSTLWEMSAEKDVVSFLQDHNAFELFDFALPELGCEHGRIIELIVGITANMCCEKEVAAELFRNQNLLLKILGYLKTDETAVMIQTLRMVSHCLYQTDLEARKAWMKVFEDIQYAKTLCFILKNSSNKDLLIEALENFNTLCEYFNIEALRKEFFAQFVTMEVLESVCTAFDEIMVKKGILSIGDDLERILAITLQIGLNLVWFDQSPEIYNENRGSVVTMITQILAYYEHKIVHNKVMDTDLEHIIESSNIILNSLKVGEITDPNVFFYPGYRIWKTLIPKLNKYGSKLVDDEEIDTVDRSIYCLSEFLTTYMAQCSQEDFKKILHVIKNDYKLIVRQCKKPELRHVIQDKVVEYKKWKQEMKNAALQ